MKAGVQMEDDTVQLISIESALDDALLAYQNLDEENVNLRQLKRRLVRALKRASWIAGIGWSLFLILLGYLYLNHGNVEWMR
jgi:hypothetical protein